MADLASFSSRISQPDRRRGALQTSFSRGDHGDRDLLLNGLNKRLEDRKVSVDFTAAAKNGSEKKDTTRPMEPDL